MRQGWWITGLVKLVALVQVGGDSCVVDSAPLGSEFADGPPDATPSPVVEVARQNRLNAGNPEGLGAINERCPDEAGLSFWIGLRDASIGLAALW